MSQKLKELTKQEAGTLAGNKVPVVVLFGASWCGPCRSQKPILEEIQQELGESVVIRYVDVERVPQLVQKFGVCSVPTVLILKDGVEAARLNGFQPKQLLLSHVKQ